MLPRPRNLRNHDFFARLRDARLYESITYGIVGTGMPSWIELSRRDRWDLIYFVRSINHTGPAALKPAKANPQKASFLWPWGGSAK